MSNKELWNRVFTTDPKAVKPITGKQYQGNSPKPYWIVERLTDEFGPCGKGWGFHVVNERFERFSETDSLHVALLEFWYVLEGETYRFQQMGQTKASYLTASGKFMLDEDAPKKSVTDALVKCASYLGFAGDIFSGRWDDSKYVAEARAHYANQGGDASPVKTRGGVMEAVLAYQAEMPKEDRAYFAELAANIEDLFNAKGAEVAYDRVTGEGLDTEQTLYLWSLLGSKVRSALKAEKAARVGMSAA